MKTQEGKLSRILFCWSGIFDAESRPVEEIPPDELNSFISEFIVTMRKKDDSEDYEPSPLRGTLASFERYLKGKNYGYSIIKDVEFKKARRTNKTSSSQHAENSAKAVNKRCHFSPGLMVQKLNFVVSQYIQNKQITSWLVRFYDFYSLVAKNH